jgi:RND family efflux transporter MFP subunit
VLVVVLGAAAAYGAYEYFGKTTVQVPVARARRGEFIISVNARGELRSTGSVILAAPQVPNLKIVTLAPAGSEVRRGQVVVQFDAAQLEQNFLDRQSNVRTVDSEIVQLQANHRITDEKDSMDKMTATYNVQRSELEASKAEVISEIQGAKNRIDVDVSKGALGQVETTISSNGAAQQADLDRLGQRKDKAQRDLEQTQSYLSKTVIRAPVDGVINVLPNFRASGQWGSTPPPFNEGDTVWTGAPIAEIPDLSEMMIQLELDEVDRGKLQLGQAVKIRVDAIPEREFEATLDWISPIAATVFRGRGSIEKNFPARATLKAVDRRMRPGMSASAEIVIESQPGALMIPARASFVHEGMPAVYVERNGSFEIRAIEVGNRNQGDLVVLGGLEEGARVTLEDPAEALKRAKRF